MPIDQCFAQTFSERLLPPSDGKKQIDPQTDIMQGKKQFGPFIPKSYVFIKSPLGLKAAHVRGGKSSVRSRDSRAHQGGAWILNQQESHTYELTETEAGCTGPTQVFTLGGPKVE